jgi:hypothetical protein
MRDTTYEPEQDFIHTEAGSLRLHLRVSQLSPAPTSHYYPLIEQETQQAGQREQREADRIAAKRLPPAAPTIPVTVPVRPAKYSGTSLNTAPLHEEK